MFTDNKYSRWYFEIINKAKGQNRKRGDVNYYENHHIIPKALGGPDDKVNRVLLTAREHFIIHWLLPKMLIEKKHKHQMATAFLRMCNPNKNHGEESIIIASRFFEHARKVASLHSRGRKFTEEHKAKIAASRRGKKRPQSVIDALKKAHTGKKLTEEHKEKIGKHIRKTYEFVDPQGSYHLVDHLQNFCKERGLSYSKMSNLHTGIYQCSTYKGWSKYQSQPSTQPVSSSSLI